MPWKKRTDRKRLVLAMEPIQITLIVLISILIFSLLVYVVMNVKGRKKRKNIDIIRGSTYEDSPVDDKELKDKRRAEIAKKLKANREEEESKGESKTSIAAKMEQAGLQASPAKFWGVSAVSGLIFLVLALFISDSYLVMILMPITGFLGLPRFILRRKIKKRQAKFLEDFADALDAVVRLLKAGMPVAEAIAMMSKEFDGPVGEEMSIIYDKQKIGVPLHEAAMEGCRRMPLAEMQMFAAGLAIQAQTGSSLSEVLSNLSNVIRSRFRLKRKIMALSSEAIASASIIGALPIVVATGLYVVNPEHIEPLFTTPMGKNMIMGTAFWMSCGVLVMKQMINFKI